MKAHFASFARALLQIGGTFVVANSHMTVNDFNTLTGAGMAIAGVVAGQLSAKKRAKRDRAAHVV